MLHLVRLSRDRIATKVMELGRKGLYQMLRRSLPLLSTLPPPAAAELRHSPDPAEMLFDICLLRY